MAEFWATISRWWIEYGVPFRVVLIIIGALVARWLLIILLGRTVNQVVNGVKKTHAVDLTAELAQSPLIAARMVQRTRTLGTVGRNLITATVMLTAFIMVLDQLGVSVSAIVASAGVVAVGLAFGAQNVIKDLLNGLFMVFEDQLGIGDSIIVGTVSGTVEAVGIRVTQVRSTDGTLWFIRNGEVLQLGNRSHGWARAILNIDVTVENNLDKVAQAITEVAREVVHQPELARKVLMMPELLGVESFHSDHSTLRLTVKTRPDAEAEVSRAIRVALKSRFDRDGINIGPDLI